MGFRLKPGQDITITDKNGDLQEYEIKRLVEVSHYESSNENEVYETVRVVLHARRTISGGQDGE